MSEARLAAASIPHHCKPRTAYEYRRAVKLFINPALGFRRISDVQTADIHLRPATSNSKDEPDALIGHVRFVM